MSFPGTVLAHIELESSWIGEYVGERREGVLNVE